MCAANALCKHALDNMGQGPQQSGENEKGTLPGKEVSLFLLGTFGAILIFMDSRFYKNLIKIYFLIQYNSRSDVEENTDNKINDGHGRKHGSVNGLHQMRECLLGKGLLGGNGHHIVYYMDTEQKDDNKHEKLCYQTGSDVGQDSADDLVFGIELADCNASVTADDIVNAGYDCGDYEQQDKLVHGIAK